MAGYESTAAEYALQRVTESVRILFSELVEHRSTHISVVVFRCPHSKNIDYLVMRYLNTGNLPFEEISEEWWFDGKV
jgi:hypothetical protein